MRINIRPIFLKKRRLLFLNIFLFWFSPSIFCEFLNLQIFYEPFLVKQFNKSKVYSVQGGGSTLLETNQETNNLWFHLLSVRWRRDWPVSWAKVNFGFEAGVSMSPLSVRKTWTLPAIDNNFTGTVTTTEYVFSDDYWGGHYTGVNYANEERYLIEDTTLGYAPFVFHLDKIFPLAVRWTAGIGTQVGVSFIYISTVRKRFEIIEHVSRVSDMHLAQTAGGNLNLNYVLTPAITSFFEFAFNAVSGLSDTYQSTLVQGYRFDGLRYNAKLGVSWKI